MGFQVSQNTLVVVTVCLVLVITSVGNFKVSAAAQQYEANILERGCPNLDEFEEVKVEIHLNIGPLIEQLSQTATQSPATVNFNEDTQSATTGQTARTLSSMVQTTEQSSALPTIEQTTEQSSALPTIEQTTEQSSALPTIEQTTEENTALPTTEQTTDHEQSMSTTTDPLYTCNGTPGWRQVVFIDMTDTSYNCPPGLRLTSYSKRTCGRAHSLGADCSSTTFSVEGSEYSRVCGRIRGYQVGSTLSFRGYTESSRSLNEQYVDGVSLTHGPDGGRQHIWTFAAGLTEENHSNRPDLCPCDRSTLGSPPFVGGDYFCESGANGAWRNFHEVFFPDDPLWDGQGCSSTSTCCQFNTPPWFTKNLPNPTTDDIELRLCLHNRNYLSDVPLEVVELYIQ